MKKIRIAIAVLLMSAPVWAGEVNSNLIAEVMPTVTNLVSLPMDQGEAIFRAEAQSEWAKVATEMSNRLANANQELRGLQKERPLGGKYALSLEQSNVVARVKEEQDRGREELRNIRLRLRARIEALKQLKREAEQKSGHRLPGDMILSEEGQRSEEPWVTQPVLVTEATRDLNGDGKPDRISIWLTRGKKHDDTELWEGAGEKYEGLFTVRVEMAGRSAVTNDLNRLFFPKMDGRMFFWSAKPWQIVFADYNHDGQPDFNLGQYGSGVACTFRLFTVSPEGQISELPVRGHDWGIPGPKRAHSTAEIKATDEGFTHHYYSRIIGTSVTNWFKWDKGERAFVLADQAPPDR
jgi:hypothetical protein